VTGLARSVVFAVALMPACKRHEPKTETLASASPSRQSARPETSAAPSSKAPEPNAPAHGDVGIRLLEPAKNCRAIDVKGRVVDEADRPITTSAPLDRPAWLGMDRKAVLAVKDTETGRELMFAGPGRVRPCVAGEEQFYLVRGSVRTTPSAGARPGAEVLVATPHGVVRYGDALADVNVEVGAISIRVDKGDAWFEAPSADGSGISEEKIPAGKRLEKKGLSVDVKALVGICEATAKVAEERARVVLKPGPSERTTPLGERAAEHMRARRSARFACALAGAALGTLENVRDRQILDQALGRAEARFRGTPSNPSNTEKSESR
jgi:hypothetical protein